ncbi:MAG: galactose mutarotase [Actinobacteria bacterium]|nr:galactose mutarotase [Actinomycetota bacterium]
MNTVSISSGSYSASIDTHGGGLASLKYEGRDLVEPRGATHTYAGDLLAPWPNRIRDGKYSWNGVDYQAPLNEAARGNNLHGLVFDKEWSVKETTGDSATLTLTIHASAAYATDLEFSVVYSLSSAGLHWQINAKNIGKNAAPYGVSVHPYLMAEAGVKNDACTLTDFDFRNGRIIGDQFIDHAFVLDDRTARIELRAPSGKGSWLSSDENAKWCQIHTSDRDGGPGSRMQLAVEPMTCAVDAFNSKDDVIELAPGASHSMWWRIGAL